jgi:hypothetical protein
MINFSGNVSNVESSILFQKTWMMPWKRVGVLRDNDISRLNSVTFKNQKL